MFSRRRFLRAAIAAGAVPAVASLSGCRALIDALAHACPENPSESGGVDWTPDVLHPVASGFRDLTVAAGAPQAMRVYFPSLAFNDERRILKLCLDRWPLVLFLHGLPPSPPCPAGDTRNFLRWRRIPSLLAKSGYVVAVPDYSAVLPASDSPSIGHMLGVIDWLRTQWEDANWVDKRPNAVAVAGHSFGALLAARLAQARPGMGAYVGLGGSFNQLGQDAGPLLRSLRLPSFFLWSDNADLAPFENLDDDGFWSAVPGPKHAAVHSGGHFDYVSAASSCSDRRGQCSAIEPAAAELIALFLGRHMPQARSQTTIPIDLVPPDVVLTPGQQFYGGARFPGLDAMKTDPGCKGVSLRWAEGVTMGARRLGA